MIAMYIELAAEIKEEYPDKHVTLIHSRSRYMARYKQSLDTFTYGILKKLGVRQVMGQRVILPEGGFPLEVKPVEVTTKTGKKIKGDLAVCSYNMRHIPSLTFHGNRSCVSA